jgi:hypothetical protein
MIDHKALPFEQHMDAPVAKAPTFLCNGLHALTQDPIVRPRRPISHRHAARADGFTRQPFAHPMVGHEMRDSFPLGSGRHHFFPGLFNALYMKRSERKASMPLMAMR